MAELLATRAELALLLELEEAEVPQARAELLLKLASGEARAYTGNLFDRVADDVVRLNGTGSRVLLLPEAPVSAVTAVVENPDAATPTTLAAPTATSPSWEWDEDGVIERIDGGVFARRRRFYSVTYTHGFAVVPDEVKGVVLQVAARAFLNPEGLKQETLGRYSYTLAGEAAGVGLYGPERSVLDAYFVSRKMREGTAPAP